jgi:splicing factor 3B subunit 2
MAEVEEDLDESAIRELLGEGSGTARSKRRREKSKATKPAAAAAAAPPPPPAAAPALPGVSIEYTEAPLEGVLGGLSAADPALAGVLAAFRRSAGLPLDGSAAPPEAEEQQRAGEEGQQEGGEEGGLPTGVAAHLPGGLTRRQRRRLLQDFVTALKGRVAHPEVVEAHDVTSTDPTLLVALKAARGTVPVPRHWCHLKRYLQGKVRATPRPPYELPDFLAATGIGTLRDLDNEANDKKSLKSKTRERARPKMGRIEVDYFVLRDAFFIHQTKPPLTPMGALHYEGKEFEKDHSAVRPGVLSQRLQEALGMAPAEGGAPPPQHQPPPPGVPTPQR